MIAISLAGHGKDSRLIQLPFLDDIPDKEKGNENYTPDYVLESCRKFLGNFDLDPFSNAIANKSVQAKTFWTKDDNALTQDWTAYKKKWVNPPYWKLSKDGCIDKILFYRAIGETLLLVNSSTSAKWFHKCMNACDAYLHPFKRIPFYNPYRELEEAQGKRKKSGNEYDQTLFYFGDRPLEFAEALSNLGNAVQPIRKSVVESNSSNNSLPQQKDFAISISGEAIIYDPNAKPVEFKETGLKITESRELYDLLTPICKWYSGRELATFAVNALGHALSNAREGKISAAVELLTNEVLTEVVKPKSEAKKLREFLYNFTPSIDAVELPVIVEAIATEPSKSVANLRMDEGSISVLVEIINDSDSVLVEDDRYQFLLERREELINSGASPQGIWINCGKVPNRDFKQAVWKSDKPRPEWGNKKSQYIGKFDGDEHKSAIAQHRAGQELRKVEREIKKLQVKS